MGLIEDAKKVLGLSKETETVVETNIEVNNVLITLEDGTVIDSSSEVAVPAVGDTWTVEGSRPEAGDYVTVEGYTVTITDGKVSEVANSEEEEIVVVEPSPMEAVALEVTELKAMMETFKLERDSLITSKEEEITEIKAELKETSELLKESIENITTLRTSASVEFNSNKTEDNREDFSISRVKKNK
jgi:hypothetical protein